MVIFILTKDWKRSLTTIVSAALSFAFALLVGALIIQATGADALNAYRVLLKGAWAARAPSAKC